MVIEPASLIFFSVPVRSCAIAAAAEKPIARASAARVVRVMIPPFDVGPAIRILHPMRRAGSSERFGGQYRLYVRRTPFPNALSQPRAEAGPPRAGAAHRRPA